MVTLQGLLWHIRNLIVTPRYFSNWYDLLFFPSVGTIRRFGLRFYFPGLRDLAYDSYVIRENFFEDQYGWLDVAGKTVVDIGANIGDTAILFALKKAKQVIAYEPYPYSYNKAKKNIELNGFDKTIKLFRTGVSSTEKNVHVKDGYSDGSQTLEGGNIGSVTKITTLNKIINKYKPNVLKSDCEGSEYEIILSTPLDKLAQFEQMMIDYHHRGPRLLEVYLRKAGFIIERREYDKYSGLLKCTTRARRIDTPI